ncbi:MAG: hypothetical protein II553_07910 [Lachnospiraceae bacterium]|nr:hypothetical protein [Lachnospiraceae bacterium]
MTLIQAVNEADNLKPNMYGLPEKIKWLSRLDRRIFEEILLMHELSDEEKEPFMVEIDGKRIFSFCAYNENDQEKELIVKEPYDEIYVHWLSAQIDWNNREYAGFNATNAVFEATYSAFRNAFNRTHMPKCGKKIYF